ncbi:AI-2E family transporter [Flavobacterium sp. SM15]|uniref:AI-2E family transporter n=1 Tax=Flavobacterium sp. SM15 TaxID=2908005 RepID=UPI002107D8E7|nr:AI-2E family transporter [Flavobacterium sp. SM15]
MTITNTSIIKKILLLILVFTGIYYSKVFLMPLLFAGILATLFLPFCNWMETKKLSKSMSVLLCFLTLTIIVLGIILLLSWKISELINDIALVKQKAIETGINIQDYIFNHLNITVEEQFKILKDEQPSYSSIVQIVVGSLTYIFSNFILVMVYFIFLLYYRIHIKNFILKLAGISQRSEMEKVIYSASNIAQQYLIGLSKMIFYLWIMYGVGFSSIGVKNAVFFAILCGLLEIVPYIGNIFGITITVLVSALHGVSFPILIGIVIIYGTVQFIQGFILEPLLLGPQVKINSLFTVIALVLGGLLWGIAGIILAIPVTAIFKIICDNVETLKPYGFLIGVPNGIIKEKGFIEKVKNMLWHFNTKKQL